MTDFLFTVPSGEPVTIEPFHYAIVGQTQFSGKTTLIKHLAQWAIDQGFKVLIWDTKETEADYAGFGQEVPVCLRESTDSFVLIGLLESMFRRRLTPYYATLSRITEGAKGFDDIIERAKKLEEKTRSSWLKDACRVLYDLLERLKNETAKVDTVPRLKLYPGINRMVINDFSLEAQQLVVKNCFEDLLRVYKRKTIGVLDEAFKFIPQGYSSPATRSIMKVMTQGAKTRLFGWISTQFLAVTDKGPLKACPFKFLGTQDHITEVKHTMDLIPEIRGKFSSDDIMKLKLGHWILVRKRPPDVRIVYSLPLDVPPYAGRNVAMGVVSPEQIRDKYLSRVQEDEELVYKEKYEELQKELKQIRDENTRLLKKLENVPAISMEELKRYKEESNTFQNRCTQLKQQIKDLKIENAHLKLEIEIIDDFKKALAKLLPKQTAGPPGFEPGSASKIGLQPTTTIVKVPRAVKHVTISDETTQGKVLTIAKKGKLDGWTRLADVVKPIIEEGWTVTPQQVNNALNDLVKQGLIAKKHTDRNYFRLAKNVTFKEAEA